MAYVTLQQVQSWLQESKYHLDTIDSEQVSYVVNLVLSKLSRRYDVTGWLSDSSTPSLVLDVITMMVASVTLRKSVSEDDGLHDYCDWLWGRGEDLLTGLASGVMDIPGVDENPASVEGGAPSFWPTQAATDLWFEDPYAEGAAARAFDMQKVF